MNRNPQTKGIWTVRRGFEPNRLSQEIMAHAYEQIVPQEVRVLLTAKREWSEKIRLTEQKGVTR